MKAATFYKYGGPEVIQIEDIPKPEIKPNQVLINVKATTVNSGDARLRRADPWLVRLMFGLTKPKIHVLGAAFAGVVSEVGSEVKDCKVGTRIYGMSEKFCGGHAEYLVINDSEPFVQIPDDMSFDTAAALAFGGTTAVHFFKGLDLDGKTMLINGASGSVGSSMVRLAKKRGVKNLTTVTSERNIALMKSLGADITLDYKTSNLNELNNEHDYVIDCVNTIPLKLTEKLVVKNGTIILIAGLVKEMINSKFIKKSKIVIGTAVVTKPLLTELIEIYKSGGFNPVIDQTFKLEDIAKAYEIVDSGRKVGNIVVTI